MKAHAYKYLLDSTYNLIAALHTKEFAFSQNSSFFSYNGKYFFSMKNDGNLVLYSVSPGGNSYNKPIWASQTPNLGEQPYLLAIERTGDLCIYDVNWKLLWNSKSGGKGVTPHRLFMEDDGDLVLKDKYDTITWKTSSARK